MSFGISDKIKKLFGKTEEMQDEFSGGEPKPMFEPYDINKVGKVDLKNPVASGGSKTFTPGTGAPEPGQSRLAGLRSNAGGRPGTGNPGG